MTTADILKSTCPREEPAHGPFAGFQSKLCTTSSNNLVYLKMVPALSLSLLPSPSHHYKAPGQMREC